MKLPNYVEKEYDSIKPSLVKHVYRCVTPDDVLTFRWEDEAGCLSDDEFDTIEECAEDMQRYITELVQDWSNK